MAKFGKSAKGKPKKVLNSKRYIEKGSVEEQRQLYELQQELMRADEDAVTFVAKNFRTKKDDTKKDMDTFTKMYYQRCLMKMAMPLQNGLSVDSAIQSVGMYAGMCLFSKDFRQNCHDIVRDVVYPYVERKANAAGPGSVWWDRKNQMLMEKDGRIPLDSKTVAIMDLGLCRGCYNKMREPGANVDAVHKEYTEAFRVLYEQAKADGVSPDDIKHDAHVIVGKFMEHDPSVAQFFEKTGDFSVTMDDYKTVQNGDGTTARVWDGEFKNKDGTPFEGVFVPRAPYGMSTFRSMMSDMLDENFANCPTFTDLENSYKDLKYVQKRDILFSMMRADGFDDEAIKQSATEVMRDRFQAWADSHSDAVKEETGKRVSEKDSRYSHERRHYDAIGPESGSSSEVQMV